MYLKLTGAAAASLVTAGAAGTAAGAGSYDRIVVPAGTKRNIRVESGQTLENKLIDVSAHDAELEIIARGDGWVIRNVGFLGSTSNSLEGRTSGSKVLKLAGNGLVENVYLGDGNDPEPDGDEKDMSRDGGIYLSGRRHTGHIEIKRSNVSMWADNGAYCSGPGAQLGPNRGGTVQFTDCYLENNNVAGIRLGTNGSGARNCTIVIDDASAMPGVPRKPEPQNPIKHGRGFWIREGTSVDGVVIDDCDISCTLDGSHEAVKIRGDSGCTIRNSRIEGPIDVDGRLRRENVSGNPNLSPPAGVPMSAEEAATGGSTLPNHLVITGTGELASYEFTVSGDLGAGPDFDTDGTDAISGSTGTGRVNNTGSDDFYFSGRITDFSSGGDLEVSVNGERINPDALLPHDLRVQAVGERANYKFSVSGDLAPGSEFDTDGTDSIDGSVGQGTVGGTSDDSFYFAGEVLRFERDGPLEVYVDGEQVNPDTINRPENHLRVQAVGERANYKFSVSGDLAPGSEFDTDGTDSIDGSVGSGTIGGTSDDDFYFDGELERFEYDGALELYVNGDQIDPDGFAGPSRTLSIVGDGSRAEYEFTVSGALEKSTTRNGSINPNDEIAGSTATGVVVGGTDSYAFDGDLTDLTVDNPDAVTVYLDGERIDPNGPGPSRTLSIVGDGPRAEYEFTVSGALEKSTARNGSINADDEIAGSSASGYVLGGTDSYAFDGEVTDFVVDDPSVVTVYLDGEQVDPDAYSLPHEITISNRGFSEPATYEFTVSGDLQATESINPSDEISGSSASGHVIGGADTYRYSGSVTAFRNEGPVDVTLDGRTVKSGE